MCVAWRPGVQSETLSSTSVALTSVLIRLLVRLLVLRFVFIKSEIPRSWALADEGKLSNGHHTLGL